MSEKSSIAGRQQYGVLPARHMLPNSAFYSAKIWLDLRPPWPLASAIPDLVHQTSLFKISNLRNHLFFNGSVGRNILVI